MQNCCDKIYSVNRKAFNIYYNLSIRDKDLLSQLFARKNPIVEQHKELVWENLRNNSEPVWAKPNGFAP